MKLQASLGQRGMPLMIPGTKSLLMPCFSGEPHLHAQSSPGIHGLHRMNSLRTKTHALHPKSEHQQRGALDPKAVAMMAYGNIWQPTINEYQFCGVISANLPVDILKWRICSDDPMIVCTGPSNSTLVWFMNPIQLLTMDSGPSR